LFGAVRARYLILTLKQYAPVERTRVVIGDTKAQKINELFESSGLSPSEVENFEVIYGAIFDFSIRTIKGFFRDYNDTGVFCSYKKKAKDLISLSLSDNVSTPSYLNEQYLYGTVIREPLIERYIYANMSNQKGEKYTSALLPIRDSSANQVEALPLFGKISRLKFFPNIYKNISKARCTASYNSMLGRWFVTCPDSIPGLDGKSVFTVYTDGDLKFIGPDGSELLLGTEYIKLTATSISVAPAGIGNRDAITSATLPYLYGFFASEQTSPIEVSNSSGLLVMGTDYQLSFDRGANWVNELPWGYTTFKKETAGDVWIKFMLPDYNDYYFVEYPILKDQWLESTKTFKLKNFRTTVAKEKRKNLCTLQTVYVMRAFSESTYYTPLVEDYSLSLRELNVSQ
jgi:hypothetical protein